MNSVGTIRRKKLQLKSFEQTNTFIKSLYDADKTVRYKEITRRRAVPAMLTFPHKESTHI